eukprot:XP_011606992.1 PREDICTED: protocadherin Fat 4-like [Takifugu rubripes]
MNVSVKEDTPPGTCVGKVDTVLETPTPITYSVLEDDGESLFLLSPLSGEFLLSRSLDFEVQSLYILTVMVQQGDSQVSSVSVYFNVLDVNDNPPVFSRGTFSAFLLEDTRVGTCFLSLNVSDKDSGDNGDVKLSVDGEDEDQVFFINPSSSLCLKAELDREMQNFYNVTVTASDRVQPPALQLTSTARVYVTVGDVNDNAPRFVSANTVKITEDAALHSVIMTIRTEDDDDGSNALVLYYLNTTAEGTFSIDSSSGEIHLMEMLNRELHDSLILTVTAIDEGSPRMTTSSSLTVLIEDVNNHDPEFSTDLYKVAVREDVRGGTSLLQVSALDRDIGMNGEVRYMLDKARPFSVDAVRGVVMVMERLDRESDAEYTLTLTAVDLGEPPRSTTAVINITVMDINDFVPSFNPELLTLHVMENEEDFSKLTYQVSALDEDFGANSQLQYFILSGNNGHFSITLNGTFQILHSLDREVQAVHVVTIIAIDSGTQTLQIIVGDINDNRPAFTGEAYNTIVSEDSPAGTVFAMVTASDIDEGVNGELSYRLAGLDMPFAIDETSGELFTTDLLDRETVAIYRLVVIGSDKHLTWPLSSSVIVTVLIGDVNDHWPQFMNGPYVAYVPTGMVAGSVVCAVGAVDEDIDLNAELHYSLYGHGSDLFSIDPRSGNVYTTGVLQWAEDLVLNVHVEDAGETPKSDTSTISIRFQNIAEFPQISVEILNGSIPENVPVGTLVAVVSAASTRAEPVSFYLASGNLDNKFHVDQVSGALTVDNPLDYEDKKGFALLMEARDSASPPFSSFEEIHISISDINDNYPQFTQAEYRCEVFENHPPSWICDVLAVDADFDNMSLVLYNIIDGNVNNYFMLDHENGLLSTTAALDREDISTFNLTIEAAELNNPSHRDRATVIVSVLDRNDNAPRFSQIFSIEVPEDSPVGHSAIQISSFDDDLGTNAVINYFIIDQLSNVPFTINFITGFITVKRPLDRETRDQYILKAVDQGYPPLSSLIEVTFEITGRNQFPPVFREPDVTFSVPEDLVVGSPIGRIHAEDRDYGTNGAISYGFTHENQDSPLSVGEHSGILTLIKELDFETDRIYHLQMEAKDGAWFTKSSPLNVTVIVLDVNDNPPVFLSSSYTISVPENSEIGTSILDVKADDADSSSNAQMLYSLFSGRMDKFAIDPGSGTITTSDIFDYEQERVFEVTVRAMNAGAHPLFSVARVVIQITDVNEFTPTFDKNQYHFIVFRNARIGTRVGRVTATDGDSGPAGQVFYTMFGQSKTKGFEIDNISGEIYTSGILREQADSRILLKVLARNLGVVTGVDVDETSVHISVTEFNAPVFTSSIYSANITEDSRAGSSVITVGVLDQDSSRVIFSIENGNTDLAFVVDPSSGVISVNSELDRELLSFYNLTLKAAPSGSPLDAETANVIVTVVDVNDNPPQLLYTEVQVRENQPQGTIVAKLTALDPDLPPNQGPFAYWLVNPPTDFSLTPDGELSTTRALDREDTSAYQVLVVVRDAGMPQLSSTAMLYIRIVDENDNPSLPRNITIEASKTHVFGIKHLGSEILLLAAAKNYNGQYLSREVAVSVSAAHRKLLETQRVSGVHCDELSYGFQEMSFIEFPPLDRRINLVSLEFATLQKNSLLLYNPGGPSSREFLALEILDGAVHLSYDLGSGPERLQTNIQVSDGDFHTVTIRRIGYVNDGKLMYMTKSAASGLFEMTVDSPVADGDWHVLDLFSNGQDTYLNVDGVAALNVTHQSLNLTPGGVKKIVFGASLTDDPLFQHLGEYTD